ncbi:hypothetical protein F4679DRAFT_556151 [Xylaria curta]|nr:hypothetical protein F4679DRAFT_556151 [Xylaria curta]
MMPVLWAMITSWITTTMEDCESFPDPLRCFVALMVGLSTVFIKPSARNVARWVDLGHVRNSETGHSLFNLRIYVPFPCGG